MAAFEAYTVPISPKKAAETINHTEVLTLAPFTQIPKIIFQDCKLAQPVSQSLMVHNPTNSDVEVELVPKIPLRDLNLKLSSTKFVVTAAQAFNLEITWTPSKAGTLKILIEVHTNIKFCTDILILCVAVESIKNPKKILGPDNGMKASVKGTPREGKQITMEQRKTFVPLGNKENVASGKQSRPTAAARSKTAVTAAGGAKTAVTAAGGAKTAMTAAAGTKTAGTAAAGTKAAGTEAAGTKTAGMAAAGPKTAGTAAAGPKTAGTAAAGTKTAGTAAAGTKTAGTAAAGTKAAVKVAAGTKTAVTAAAGTKAAVKAAAGVKTAATAAATAAVATTAVAAPDPASRELYSAATAAHPSRFQNLAISPFVPVHKRPEEVGLAIGGSSNRTSLVAPKTFGLSTLQPFMKSLDDLSEEPDCTFRELGSYTSVFWPRLSSTAQKGDEASAVMELSFVGENGLVSAETSLVEGPAGRRLPMENDKKDCCRDLSATFLQAINEEDAIEPAATSSQLQPFSSECLPTSFTKRKLAVLPEISVFTPPGEDDNAKKSRPAPTARAAMPRLTPTRAALTPRQSSAPRKAPISATSRKAVFNASTSSSLSVGSAHSSSQQSLSSCASSSSRTPRLTSSARARRQEKSEFLCDANALISEMINNDLVAASTSADPFLANTLFFDDSWKRKQETDMIKWLNVLLTPPAELAASTDSVDLATVWQRCCRAEVVELAPTREDVSAEVYDAAGRLSSLRKAAVSFLAQTEIRQVLGKVAVHIDKKLLVVREDKDLHLDPGLKYQVMELLLCYNPLWLRIGLEALYGRTLSLASNCDVVGLAKFIVDNLLTDRNIVAEHSHPTVPHLRQPTFGDAMKKFILKKFFFLVYFLDQAKTSKLIRHDPCLFMKSAKYKESREILLAFSSRFLSGAADMMRHLALLGYHVSVKQQYIDEYEFAVTCLKDLRDGVRLVRAMEIILKKDGLIAKLRVPAISMLQKVHNMEIALNALSQSGYVITGNITAKDLVNGHYDKTLSLLWQVIFKFQGPRLHEAAKKIQAWWRNQRLYVEIENRIEDRRRTKYVAAVTRIQAAWRGWLARKRVAKLQEEKAAEEARREIAAVTIQKTWRMYAARKQLIHAIKASNRIKQWFFGAIITRDLRQEFLQKRQAAIKIQSAVRGFLARKKVTKLKRTAAALLIQRWFRRRRTAAVLEEASVLARGWVAERQRKTEACRVIQVRLRALLALREARGEFLRLKSAAVVLQSRWRALTAMREAKNRHEKLKRSIVLVQNRWRAIRAGREARREFEAKRNAALVLQRRWRATVQKNQDRTAFLELRSATIILQTRRRDVLKRRADQRAREALMSNTRVQAATKIQAVWRGYSVRKVLSSSLREVVKRCNAATMEACEEKTLVFRFRLAVDLLRSGDIHEAFEALTALNKIICLSRELCISIAEGGVVTDVYNFLGKLNRSELHREFLVCGTNILLQMAKCGETIDYVWQDGQRTFLYLHLMNVWLAKDENIFLNCATVLWHFLQRPECAKVLLADPKISCFLDVFHKKTSKMKTLSVQSLDIVPSCRPSWGLVLKHEGPVRFPTELGAVRNLIGILYDKQT